MAKNKQKKPPARNPKQCVGRIPTAGWNGPRIIKLLQASYQDKSDRDGEIKGIPGQILQVPFVKIVYAKPIGNKRIPFLEPQGLESSCSDSHD